MNALRRVVKVRSLCRGFPRSWSSRCLTDVTGAAVHAELSSAVPAIRGTTEAEPEGARLALEVSITVLAPGT